jgi:hypothetical protein
LRYPLRTNTTREEGVSMKVVRLAALTLAVATTLALAACAKGQLPPSVRDGHVSGYETDTTGAVAPTSSTTTGSASANGSGDASAPAGPAQYSGTVTEGSVAIGAELQRTAAGELAGKMWVMSTDGKADLVGASPQFALAAVGKAGRQVVVWKGASTAPGSGPVSSQQTSLSLRLPAGTARLVLTTTLKPEGSSAKAPVLAVALSDIPVVKDLGATGEPSAE